MSRLSSLPTNLRRSHSATSVAASVTTYHSFQDIEGYEPASSPVGIIISRMPQFQDDSFEPKPIRRHDSGYESIYSGSRSSGASQSSHRRTSTISTKSSRFRPRTRPSIRRATRSTPNPHIGPMNGQQIHLTGSHKQPITFYQFPAPESITASPSDEELGLEVELSYPAPPQTTHYWTSDHTRRLEYAAIDAASRGVKGWFMKYMVPDCFVPKENRRLGFDDDAGSVRRYRLDLDNDETGEKDSNGGKKMGWLLGR